MSIVRFFTLSFQTKFEAWIQTAWQRDEIVLNRERARVMFKYYERMVRDLDARYAHLESALEQGKGWWRAAFVCAVCVRVDLFVCKAM